jgi:hypothetical protein
MEEKWLQVHLGKTSFFIHALKILYAVFKTFILVLKTDSIEIMIMSHLKILFEFRRLILRKTRLTIKKLENAGVYNFFFIS